VTARLVVGTIRARRGERHDVVLPDGTVVPVAFDGEATPAIGADVVGLFDPEAPGTKHLTLVHDVTRLIMSGRARIVTGGRSDVTARMLARMTQGAGIGAITPGTGGIIERTPTVEDPDLNWALTQLAPEARRLGLGLNVIDPLALAKAPWEDRRLKEDLLPADTTGDLGALEDLKRIMAEGFTPACRRTLFGLARGVQVPSVDFVLPYSPFETGHSFSARMAGAKRAEVTRLVIPGPDARRLSSFREIARAFAPRHLGRQRGNQVVAAHVEATFADVAAALAYLAAGGDPRVIRAFAALRQAGFARSPRAPSSHQALQTVLSVGSLIRHNGTGEILKNAASLAKSHTPGTEEAILALRAETPEGDVLFNPSRATASERDATAAAYAEDCEDAIARLADVPVALERMGRFGLKTVPLGLDHVFDEVMDRMGAPLAGFEEEAVPMSFGSPWDQPPP